MFIVYFLFFFILLRSFFPSSPGSSCCYCFLCRFVVAFAIFNFFLFIDFFVCVKLCSFYSSVVYLYCFLLALFVLFCCFSKMCCYVLFCLFVLFRCSLCCIVIALCCFVIARMFSIFVHSYLLTFSTTKF